MIPRAQGLALALLLGAAGACEHGFADPEREFGPPVDAAAQRHQVQIHQPKTLGVVDTPLKDVNGEPVGVSCVTCHGPNADGGRFFEEQGHPDVFHSGVAVVHGALSCNACHQADDRRYLHLADGETLEFGDTMRLCAQCHGVQYRDYRHGSHGGMNGYWDLNRGPRVRNHCVDCHAPHAPAHEPVRPVHRPRDRGMIPSDGAH